MKLQDKKKADTWDRQTDRQTIQITQGNDTNRKSQAEVNHEKSVIESRQERNRTKRNRTETDREENHKE